MSINTRPSSRIVMDGVIFDLIDAYETVVKLVEEAKPDDRIRLTRWDNHKEIHIRVGAIDQVQEMGY